MKAQEIIDNLEAEVLRLLRSGLKATLKVEVSIELYREIEKRGYFRCNHSTVCQIWQGLPIEVCPHLGKPYEIKMVREEEIINLFKTDEIAIPRYNAPFKYYGI